MASPTDVAVVPLRAPRALAGRARVAAADSPRAIVAATDVDAALDIYDLCIGCRGVQDPQSSADEEADLALGNAQKLGSLVLQYIEARFVDAVVATSVPAESATLFAATSR